MNVGSRNREADQAKSRTGPCLSLEPMKEATKEAQNRQKMK
jgi:hypothetical protein